MCGLVGVINREKYKIASDKLIKYFNQALFMDTVRGKHGTGVSAVDNKGVLLSYKKAMAAPDFLDLKYTQTVISPDDNVFLSGHNRWATQGSHTDENSHPFNHSNITMFHNGTLDSVTDLPSGNTFIVDSDAIAYSLSKIGSKATLEALDGAFALVWYDSEDESLNFARNKDRPLWFGHLSKSDSSIYASEKDMLFWLASRNDIDLEAITELPVGKHFKMFLNKPSEIEVFDFTPKVSVWEGYYPGHYDKDYFDYPAITPKGKNLNGELLVGEEIELKVESFNAYNTNIKDDNKYGVIIGRYWSSFLKLSLEVRFSGIKKEVADKLIGKDVTGIVTSTNSNIQCRSPFLSKTNTSTNIIPFETSTTIINGNYGPNSEMKTDIEFKELISLGCCCCGKSLSEEKDVNIHWDSEQNPYCVDCLSELYV